MVRPLERFLQQEAGSASLLLAAAIAALVWANAWPDSYESFWDTVVSIDLASVLIEEDLQHWINDLLMAVFFYVVALEVKREMVFGSLRDRRSAAVPAAAALGTMFGAALTYLAVNLIGDGDLRGWESRVECRDEWTWHDVDLPRRRHWHLYRHQPHCQRINVH